MIEPPDLTTHPIPTSGDILFSHLSDKSCIIRSTFNTYSEATPVSTSKLSSASLYEKCEHWRIYATLDEIRPRKPACSNAFSPIKCKHLWFIVGQHHNLHLTAATTCRGCSTVRDLWESDPGNRESRGLGGPPKIADEQGNVSPPPHSQRLCSPWGWRTWSVTRKCRIVMFLFIRPRGTLLTE